MFAIAIAIGIGIEKRVHRDPVDSESDSDSEGDSQFLRCSLSPEVGDIERASASHMRTHNAPGDEAFVHRAEAAAQQAAEKIQKLDRRVGIHREDLLEQRFADREDGGRR